ncbi:histidine kinase [Streptomyces tendae]
MRVRSSGQDSGGGHAPRPSARVRRAPAGAARRVRREAVAGWAAVRGAGRRTVVVEGLLCLLTAAFGLVPLLLVVPARPGLAVAEALWAVLLVALRRGRPVAAVLGSSLLVVGVNVWTLAVAPLVVMSATRRIAPTRRAWRVVGAASAVVGVLSVATVPFRTEPLAFQLVGNAISFALLLVLPALAGTLLGQRRPLVSLLRERNAYLERARALTAEAARAEERNRIAGEMHDLLGHRLSLISVHARGHLNWRPRGRRRPSPGRPSCCVRPPVRRWRNCARSSASCGTPTWPVRGTTGPATSAGPGRTSPRW